MILSSNRNYKEFGYRVGFPHPIANPVTDPNAGPFYFISANDEYIEYINGAIKRLVEEETFEREDDSVRQDAIEYFDNLMASWQSAFYITAPRNYIKPNGSLAPAGLPTEQNYYDGATQQYFRVSTGFNIQNNWDEASIALYGWNPDTDSREDVLLYYLEIRIVTSAIPGSFSSDVQWAISEDGGIIHSQTTTGYIITRETLGIPILSHLQFITVDTDNGPLWWFVKSGKGTSEG